MTQKTESEIAFERFCDEIGVPWNRVPPDLEITPDYCVRLDSHLVVVEVKECERTQHDEGLFDIAHSDGAACEWVSSDVRVRKKIKRACRQLKARSKGKVPALTVIFDRGTFAGIDGTDIKNAMYGDEVVTASPIHRSVSAIHAGGNRQMTESYNTTISAVALLYNTMSLARISVFHNQFASNPIRPDWLRHERVRHLSLASDLYEWIVI